MENKEEKGNSAEDTTGEYGKNVKQYVRRNILLLKTLKYIVNSFDNCRQNA